MKTDKTTLVAPKRLVKQLRDNYHGQFKVVADGQVPTTPNKPTLREELSKLEFYNPGLTRYLKLGEKEIDQIHKLIEERIPKKQRRSTTEDGHKFIYKNGWNACLAEMKKEMK